MISDLALRWLVTGLSLLSGTGFLLVIDRRSVVSVLSHGSHVVMAIAMVVMAWPQGSQLPTTLPEAFFVVAGLWFVGTAVLAARRLVQRVICGYGAATMFAMSWMYAVMNGRPRPGQVNAEHQHQHHHHVAPDMDATPMDVHPTTDWPSWIDAGNWIWTAVFVLAALAWGYWLLAQRGGRRRRRGRVWRLSLGSAGQAMMAVAMAIMFATMLSLG